MKPGVSWDLILIVSVSLWLWAAGKIVEHFYPRLTQSIQALVILIGLILLACGVVGGLLHGE